MRLNATQRNSIFEAIVSARQDPRDFTIAELAGGNEKVVGEGVSHPSTGSFFAAERGDAISGGFVIYFKVGGGDVAVGRRWDWDGVLGAVPQWLKEVEAEASAIDLWATLADERKVLGALPAPETEAAFTDAEKAQIFKQLDEIRRYAKTALDLSEQGTQRIEERLTYLEGAADRLGRKDWRMIAVGTFVTLAAEAVIPPEELRNLLMLLLQPVAGLFGQGLPPPSTG